MRYGSKSKEDKNNQSEHDAKAARAKSDLSVKVIQYNHFIDGIINDLEKALHTAREMSLSFGNQREILARSRMSERVLNSSLKMIAGNKLHLWMINDREIEEGLN